MRVLGVKRFTSFSMFFLLAVSGMLLAEYEIISVDPTDGRLMNARVLGEWNTAGDFEGWTPASVASPAVANGTLTGTGSSGSPSLTISIDNGPDLDFGFFDYLQFRLKVPAAFSGEIIVYFGTTTHPLNGSQKLTIPADQVIADGQWHTYRMDLGLVVWWRDTLNRISFYPLGSGGSGLEFSIDYFEVGDLPGDTLLVNTDININTGAGETFADCSRIESKHAVFWYSPESYVRFPNFNPQVHGRRALRMIEECYQVYCKKLNYLEPFESIDLWRRDGNRYKINHVTWYDGFWCGGHNGFMHIGINGHGLGDEGWGNPMPHEFAHYIQGHQPGFLTGGHWESHANFLRDSRTEHYAPLFTSHPTELDIRPLELSNLRQDHGRLIYADFRIHAALKGHAADMGLSPTLVGDFWTESPKEMTVYDKLAQMIPAGCSVKDVVAACMRHWPLLDMNNPSYNAQLWNNANSKAWWFYITGSYLVPCADKPGWWRVPLARAPEKYASMSHALTPTASTVTVELRGMDVHQTGEDWRWSLAAVDAAGNARYSDLWQPGTYSMALNPGEGKVYLLVTATPDSTSLNLGDHDNVAPIDKHPDRLRYPYEVRITGASPAGVPLAWSTGAGRAHPNGGGFVANTATVAGTAYVGPNAKVLESANVSNYARIEDYAVIAGSARVRDNAVVSGYAVVRGNANVYGRARIRDRAVIEGGVQVSGYAKVEEFAHPFDNPTFTGNAVVRGVAMPFTSSTLSGTAIASHDYSMGFNLSDGVLFSHVPWGGFYGDYYFATCAKPRGLKASYRFDRNDTGEVCWDEFGDKHAFFRGSPSFSDDIIMNGRVLSLNGADQYLVFDRDLCDSYAGGSYAMWVKPDALTPGMPLLFMGSAPDRMIKLSIADSAGRVKLTARNAPGQPIEILSAAPVSPTRWTHVCVVLNGTTAALYIDGVLSFRGSAVIRPEDVLAANDYSQPEAMYVGRDGDGNLYAGLVEDVRFYNVPLTDAEVRNEFIRRGDCLGAFFTDTETDFNGLSTTFQSGVHAGLERRFEADIYPRTADDVGYYEGIFDCTDERNGSGSGGSGVGIDAGVFKVKLDGQSSLWNTSVPVTLNQWQHITLAFNGTQARFYVDGQLRASRSYSASASSVPGKNYRIGFAMDRNGNPFYFDGKIKNARICDKMEVAVVTQPEPDITGDGLVDLSDLAELVPYWLVTGASEANNWSDGMDLNMDGSIDMSDFAMIAALWLYDPTGVIPTVGGDFSEAWDFLANGTEGTGWDGLVGVASASAVNSNIDRPGQLFLQSANGVWAENWSPLGPFLYKVIEGDFIADVKVTGYAGTDADPVYHNNAGLMVRASTYPDQAGPGEDWLSIDYFPIWNCGNMVRTANDNVRTDGVANNNLAFNLYPWLRIERSGNAFTFLISPDGTNWTLLHGPVTRADFDGLPLQVGLFQATYSATSGYVAFDDFVITQD